VAKGTRSPRDTADPDSLPLFPSDASDKSVSRRRDRVAVPNVVAMPRKAGPTPEALARQAMAHKPDERLRQEGQAHPHGVPVRGAG
jgi:hypothetical protein